MLAPSPTRDSEHTYLVACPKCGYSVRGLTVSGLDNTADQVYELATCTRCRQVLSVKLPPIKARVQEYIRQIEGALAQLRRRESEYEANLQRRVSNLKGMVEAGKAAPGERARYARTLEMLKRLERHDTSYLEERLMAARKALEHASDGPFFHACGAKLIIHEDAPTGYKINCPHCNEPMVVRLEDKSPNIA